MTLCPVSPVSHRGWLCYADLMELCNITDEEQPGCAQADIDTIFKAANFELKGSDPKDDNPLEVLCIICMPFM